MLLEFTIALTASCILIYLYFTRHFNHWKSKNIPYLKPIPFAGNCLDALLMKTSLGEIFQSLYQSSAENYVGIFLCDKPCLLARDPDLIKSVLIKDFNHFYDRSVAQNFKHDPIGANILFVLKNPDWREIRTKITPIFTSAKLKGFHTLIQNSGRDMVEYLKSTVSGDDCVVNVREITARYTTDVISSTAFGIDANCFNDEDAQLRNISRRMFDWNNVSMSIQMRCFFIAPVLVKLFRMSFLDQYCTKFLSSEFWKVMDHRKSTKTTRSDMIDLLLQIKDNDETLSESIKLDGSVLVAQTIQFFTAGYETTSGAITYALFELARNKAIQDKLRVEINRVAEGKDEIGYDELKKMVYLNMIFKETLRKYPPIPFLERKCNADYKIPGTASVIDKDTPVFIPVLGLHHDPELYPNPQVYDPERFTEEKCKDRPIGTYLPFGDGPRNCLGGRFGIVSGTIGLAYIIRNFEVDATCSPNTEIKIDPRCFFLTPYDHVMLKFRRL